MSEEQWKSVDDYFCEQLLGDSDNSTSPTAAALAATLHASDAAGLPEHNVAPNQGKLLMLLAQIQGARRILEIGTLGGYSTLWLASALPSNGHLDTLEANAAHAEVARKNIASAQLDAKVSVHEGSAKATLERFVERRAEAYDFVFVDADKQNNSSYVELSLALSRPGSVIVVDNVVRDGGVANPNSDDSRVHGVRDMMKLLAAHPRLDATAIQTVGSKGYDGFALLRVR